MDAHRILSTLLSVFGKNGMHSKVLGVFKEMKKAGFEPERDTFNTLMGAYSRCGSRPSYGHV